jgi:hypothetical protein
VVQKLGLVRQTYSICCRPQENRKGSEVALVKAEAASRQEVNFEQDYLHI